MVAPALASAGGAESGARMRLVARYGVPLLAFLVPVGAWIQWGVGGFPAYTALFAGPVMGAHVGPSFLRSAYDNVAIIAALSLLLIRPRETLRHPLFTGFLASYVAFSLFAREVGPYAAMVMPFVYGMLLVGAHAAWHRLGKPLRLGLAALLLLLGGLHAGVAATRAANLWVFANCRAHSDFDGFLGGALPAEVGLVADAKFYHAARRQAPAQLEQVEWNTLAHVAAVPSPAFALADADRILGRSPVRPFPVDRLLASRFELAELYECRERDAGAVLHRLARTAYAADARTYRRAAVFARE
jgi:hypothetical protein